MWRKRGENTTSWLGKDLRRDHVRVRSRRLTTADKKARHHPPYAPWVCLSHDEPPSGSLGLVVLSVSSYFDLTGVVCLSCNLYTGGTRGKRLVVVIGQARALAVAMRNVGAIQPLTNLAASVQHGKRVAGKWDML